MHCSQGQKKTSVYDGIDLEIQMFNEEGMMGHSRAVGGITILLDLGCEDDGIYEVVDD